MKRIILSIPAILLFPTFLFSQSVNFTPGMGLQNWTVPACVTSITVTMAGGEGGGPNGGNGAVLTGTYAVTPGQVIQFQAGGAGSAGTGGGGANGGGMGRPSGVGWPSFGGGGKSVMSIGGVNIAVAAGGGGAGGGDDSGLGGTGGCPNGTAGSSPFGIGGGGATTTAGGTGGPPWTAGGGTGSNGSLGTGGAGAVDVNYGNAPGGGGGAGVYGGGGGGSDNISITSFIGGGGGGGGSSLIPAGWGCGGTNNGAGYITVTYTAGTPPTVNAGPDVTRCPGQSATLTATGTATSYTWSPATGLSTTTGATTVATPASTTTYTVTGSSACGTVTDQVVVTISPLPTINAGADVSRCIGTPATLTATGGATYTWSPSTGLSATTGASVTATPTTTTTYTVSGTSAAGCVNTDQVIVTINPLPTINAGADVTICPTQSTTLTAAGGSTYTWSPATGLSGTTGASVTATPAATTTYTVSGTSAAGCVSTDQVVVTVNSTATINAGADVTICPSASTTLTASGGATYTWAPGTGLSATTGTSVTASPAATTTYTVTGTTASGCTGTDQVIVTISALPAINAGADVSRCVGTPATLTATGGATYTWSPGTGLSATTGASVTATPTTTTTYTVSGTSAAGCINTDQVVVTINPIPTISAGPDVQICPSQSTTLTATGGSTYTWSPGTGLSATTGSTVTATPAATTTYTVSGTSAAGCISTDQVVVTINATAAINAGPDVAICPGASTTLTASGGATYTWSPATGLSATTGASVTASPAATTTYTVSGTTASGCVGSDQVIVTINPLPTVGAGADVAICNGASTTLTATGAATYSWSPATGLSGATGVSVTANPTTTTTYTVSGTSAAGCVNTDQVIVTVNPIPNVSAGPDDTVCPNEPSVLNASGATSYTWSPATGLSATTGATVTATISTTTTYTVTGTSLGCTASDAVTVTVNNLAPINAGADVSICTGASTTLTVSGGATYTWSPATGLSATTGSSVIANPTATTTYTVSGTTALGCTGTDQVVVTVNPLPTTNAGADATICNGASTTLNATGANTYTWSPSTGLSGTTGPIVTASPSTTTTYTVSGTTAAGCTLTDQVVVTVNPIPNVNAGSDVSICPGNSTTLGASGATTYTWSPAAGLSATNVSNPTANPASTTTYTVTGTSLGCIASDNVVVSVNSSAVINAGTDVTMCQGGSTTLLASGGMTYVWDNGLGAGNGVSITPLSTTTYGVTGTDANGCVGTDNITVTINPNPMVNAGIDQAVCPGVQVTLAGSGASTYTWTGGITNNSAFTPVGTSSYTVTGTDANGCIGTDQATITVYSNPIVNAGVDQEVCTGTSVTLAGSGAATYTWNNSVTDGVAFTPAIGTLTYTVVGTSVDGCTGTDNLTLTVNPLPNVGAGLDVEVCDGTATTLNGSGAVTYNWSNGISNGVAFTQAVGTVNYTVTGTDANGCINSDIVSVLVNPNPVLSFTADVLEGCTPLLVTFTNTSAGNLASCVWTSSNGLTEVGCGPVQMTFVDGGTFDISLTSTSTDGCSSTTTVNNYIYAEDIPVAAFSANPPQVSSIMPEIQFINNSVGATSYDWNFGDGSPMSQVVNPIHLYPEDTDAEYEVMLIASSPLGCVDTTYLEVSTIEELIYYIPNTFTPDDDQFNPTFLPIFTSGFDPFDYQLLIFDRWGEIIFESLNHEVGWDGTYGVNEVNVCQEGTYTYKIEFKTSANDERKVVTGHVNLLK